jgi:hypothetical protein
LQLATCNVEETNVNTSGEQRIPTSKDVVAYLNERLQVRGLPYRVERLSVLPYVNPMWLANWDVPQLADAPERDVVDEELREARWLFPQILDEW